MANTQTPRLNPGELLVQVCDLFENDAIGTVQIFAQVITAAADQRMGRELVAAGKAAQAERRQYATMTAAEAARNVEVGVPTIAKPGPVAVPQVAKAAPAPAPTLPVDVVDPQAQPTAPPPTTTGFGTITPGLQHDVMPSQPDSQPMVGPVPPVAIDGVPAAAPLPKRRGRPAKVPEAVAAHMGATAVPPVVPVQPAAPTFAFPAVAPPVMPTASAPAAAPPVELPNVGAPPATPAGGFYLPASTVGFPAPVLPPQFEQVPMGPPAGQVSVMPATPAQVPQAAPPPPTVPQGWAPPPVALVPMAAPAGGYPPGPGAGGAPPLLPPGWPTGNS